MVDLLVAFVQSVCLLGYLYGAWLVITHRPDPGPMRGRASDIPVKSHAEDEAAWRRYLACDL